MYDFEIYSTRLYNTHVLLKNTRNIKICGRHLINRYNKYTFNVPDFTLRQHGNDYGNTYTRLHVVVFN